MTFASPLDTRFDGYVRRARPASRTRCLRGAGRCRNPCRARGAPTARNRFDRHDLDKRRSFRFAAIARPRSAVVARAAEVGRLRRRRVRQHALDRRDDRGRRLAVAEEVEHQRARPDLADRIGDALAGDVGRRAVHRLEQRREVALGIEVGRRRDADRAADGRAEIGQDVAEEVGADDDVEAARAAATKCAVRMSMWNWSVRMSGYCAAIARKRSSQYGIVIAMPFDLVAEVTCFAGRVRASSNANRRMRSTPLRENTDSWNTISRSVPSNIRPPTDEYSPSVFSRTTTKSMSPGLRLASGDGDARHQLARAQVDVLVEARAGTGSASPTATRDRAPSPASRPRRRRSPRTARAARTSRRASSGRA